MNRAWYVLQGIIIKLLNGRKYLVFLEMIQEYWGKRYTIIWKELPRLKLHLYINVLCLIVVDIVTGSRCLWWSAIKSDFAYLLFSFEFSVSQLSRIDFVVKLWNLRLYHILRTRFFSREVCLVERWTKLVSLPPIEKHCVEIIGITDPNHWCFLPYYSNT